MKRIPYTRDYAELTANFDCGSATTYQTEVSDWIRGIDDEVWAAIELRGVQVWLYLTDEDDPIGFAALALQILSLDESPPPFGETLVLLFYAVQAKYHKKPDGPWQQYYSRQVLHDVLAEARSHPSQNTKIGLYVHPANSGAIRLYEQFGFVKCGHFVGYDCMIKDLTIPESPLPVVLSG